MLIFVQIIFFCNLHILFFFFFLAPQESLIPTNTNAAADQKRVSTLAKTPDEYSPFFGFIDGNVCCRVIPTVSMFEIHIYNNIQFLIFFSLFYMPNLPTCLIFYTEKIMRHTSGSELTATLIWSIIDIFVPYLILAESRLFIFYFNSIRWYWILSTFTLPMPSSNAQ